MIICHYTTVHKRYDTRILYKPCFVPFYCPRSILILADGKGDEVKNGVKIIDLGKHTNLFQDFLQHR